MSRVPSHRDLIVWQKAMDLVEMTYDLVRLLPPEERFAMVPQMTRAAVSIPANIAEGKGRGTPREYIQFLRIARGSLMELDTYIELVVRLGYITEAKITPIREHIVQVGKMITALRASIAASFQPRNP